MITYREFSSLCTDLGFSGKALYGVSHHTERHYRAVRIPKGNGEFRQLYVPDDFLKAIQSSISEKLLSLEAVSSYATAYRPGQRQQVTGIIVNDKMGVPAGYKRKIRQEVYYCKKFGVRSHLEAAALEKPENEYLAGLLGRINYVLFIEPENNAFAKYKAMIERMMKMI